MCGIGGKVIAGGRERVPAPHSHMQAQQHRGPDAAGFWADEHCALGHRRLSIIDLSEAGRQPMSNEDGSVWITFNGEVYNFARLRDELEGLGHRFRSKTDTEVLIHAYEQWGTECVRRFRGMFAFGIWDRKRRRLFLARDRVGKKPLFYCHQTQEGDRFTFASELQGLLADPEIPRTVDLAALDAYLSWGYVPGPATGFSGIAKLLPGHWLTLDVTAEGFRIRTERYWSLDYLPKLRISEADACEGLREKLSEAVRLRMISDVPLGAFLSGGVDSSIVVGLMAQASDRPVKTFSIGFTEAAYNELDHARRVAERWGTEHEEHVVRPDALSILPMLVRHYGEPYADSSAIPTYYVAQMTRRSVTVALNGDGGDESFAGYERYLAAHLAERLRHAPGFHGAAGLLQRLVPDSIDPKNRLRRLHRFLAVAHRPLAERYGRWVSYFHPEDKAALYGPELAPYLPTRSDGSIEGEPQRWMRQLFENAGACDVVDAAMSVDVHGYLPYDLLVKVDIAAMATSLEARSPFLDHEVMEFAARLPVSYKLRGRRSKYLLKRTFADLLPGENARRGKMGFGVPVGDWFRGPLRELLQDSLLSPGALGRGYFQPEAVRSLIEQHLAREADHSFKLWSLLMLELWHTCVVDPPAPAPQVSGAASW